MDITKKFIQGYDYLVRPLRKYTIRNSNDSKNPNFKKEKKIEKKIEKNENKSKINSHGINPDKFDLEEDIEAEESYQKLL